MLEPLIEATHWGEVSANILRIGRGLEVEVYGAYLDLWWEVQFLLDPALLNAAAGC